MLVRVRNPQYGREGIWFFPQPEFHEYSGDEVRLKWANPDSELCLTTGLPEWPVRVIQRSLIVSIDGRDYRARPINPAVIVRKIQGSKGKEYTLTGSGGTWSCTCPGFQFRSNCKHTQGAR